jgi:DNA-binding response OmpR family regulator
MTISLEREGSSIAVTNGISPALLYVDDDETIRRTSGEILLQAGCSVDLAETGERGWEALQLKKYDLLITDHGLPHLSGLELAVRARESGLVLPIIIASSCATFAEDDAYAWLRLSSLRKPFTPAALLQTVVGLLRAAKQVAEVINAVDLAGPIAIFNTAEVGGPTKTAIR